MHQYVRRIAWIEVYLLNQRGFGGKDKQPTQSNQMIGFLLLLFNKPIDN